MKALTAGLMLMEEMGEIEEIQDKEGREMPRGI